MPSRPYAQIECSLTSSKRLRGLSDHKTRWAYLCAHLSDYCTYTGLFRYPVHVWAYDAQLDMAELSDAINEMVRTGLMDHDEEESYVRIIGWFHKRNGPENPNRVDSVIADLCGLDDVDPTMVCKSASELASSTVKRAIRWAPEKGQAQAYSSLKDFLGEMYQDHGDLFLGVLRNELEDASATVCNEIRAMLPALTMVSNSAGGKGSGRVTPTLREHETRRHLDETNTKTKKDLDETSTSECSEAASLQMVQQAESAEMPRKSERPTLSAINSTIAKAAKQGRQKKQC